MSDHPKSSTQAVRMWNICGSFSFVSKGIPSRCIISCLPTPPEPLGGCSASSLVFSGASSSISSPSLSLSVESLSLLLI